MTTEMDGATLQRALRAQLGAVVRYRSRLAESHAEDALDGDCEAVTGRGAEAFAGPEALRLEQLLFPGDAARVRRERDLQLKKSADYSLQYRLVRPDGTQVWVRDTGTQQVLEDGTVLREGLLADITAPRELAQRAGRLEQELENTRALLTAISDGTDAHLMVLDGEAAVFLVNRSWLEYDASRGLPHASREAWVGHNFLELIAQRADPALGGAEMATAVRDIQAAARNAARVTVVVPLQWETHYFVLTATRLHGDFNGVLVVRQNVTDLKRAELAVMEQQTFLHSILDSSRHLGVVGINQEQRVALFNPAASAIFGTPPPAVVGRPLEVLQQLLPADAVWRRQTAAALEAREDSLFETGDFPGAPDRLFENRLTQVEAPDGTALGSVMLLRDITDERAYATRMQRMNEELEQRVQARTRELEIAKEQAEAASRAKSTFLSNMSHEIRTPMNAVIGMTDLVLETALDQQQLKLLRSVSTSAKSLLSILNDILDVSKLESGKMELERIPFSISGLLTDVGEMMGVNARRKGLSIELHLDERTPAVLLGDPTKLRQIIVNLIGNAIKFTEKGSVTLDLKPADALDEYHFSVIDTGIGIAASALPKIFERFSQADESTTRRFGGTGLGTAISKGIVEEMGGHIWVESQEGVGSNFQFVVRLPVAEGVDEAEFLTDKLRQSGRWTRPLKVLYAEDIELNQQLVQLRFTQRKHQVDIAENGRVAVEMYLAGHYDLVLMDAHMPVMNVLDAIREIRRVEQGTAKHVPIIMLTASVQQSDRDLCLAAGADDFAWKPIEFDVLYDKIANFFESFAHAATVLETSNPTLEHLPLRLIDVQQGLELWGESGIFRSALLKMGRDYGDCAPRTTAFCKAGEWQAAREFLHAFKGVAGNLSVRELPAIANELENEVKLGGPVSQVLLVRLAERMRELQEELRQIERLTGPDGQNAPAALDIPAVMDLLKRLLEQLDTAALDDDTIGALRGHLGPERFAPIEIQLESFELGLAADAARSLLTALAAPAATARAEGTAVVALLRRLMLALEDSELDEDALAALRGVLDPGSFARLEESLDAFEFPTAIAMTNTLIRQYENTHD